MLPSALLSRLGSASGALSDRQRARFTSERVSAEEDGAAQDAPASPASLDDTTSLVVAEATSTANNNDSPTSSNSNHAGNENHPEEDDRGEEDDLEAGHNHEEPHETSEGGGNDNVFYRTTMTLAELEEERELSRRRMSACVLLTVFVLFKLWIDCIEEPSLPLLMVCLIGTSWTARWIRYNREREEELDRRIAQYLQSNNNNNHADGEGVMDRNDLRMLSFQAQLALAIMESQRHMMEGGRPDSENQDAGVSEAAKGHWETIKFHDDSAQYGSVKEVDGPHCSICLCEYEEGDQLTKLPCQHLYHQECIDSWTEHHTKCPLCNMDLESVTEGSASLAESNIV